MKTRALVFLFLVTMCACMQKAEHHMENMDNNTGRLATELENDRKPIEALSKDVNAVSTNMKNLDDRSQEMIKQMVAYEKYMATLAASFSRLVASIERLEKGGTQMMELVAKLFLSQQAEDTSIPEFDDDFKNAKKK